MPKTAECTVCLRIVTNFFILRTKILMMNLTKYVNLYNGIQFTCESFFNFIMINEIVF